MIFKMFNYNYEVLQQMFRNETSIAKNSNVNNPS